MIFDPHGKLQTSDQLSQHHPFLYCTFLTLILFCRRGTVDFVAIPSRLLNSIVTEHLINTYSKIPGWNTSTRNYLSSSFCQQASPVFLSYRSKQCQCHTNLSHKPSLQVRDCCKNYIKKNHTVTILKRFSHFQNNTWSQIFFCAFFFTQVQAKLIEVSCFTSTAIPKHKTQFDWLVLTHCFMLDRPLNFAICFSML